jgi:Protein of unknown function (DUF2997)
MSRVIEVTVSPQGKTTLLTKGYFGAGCREASRFLEQALGLTTADTTTAEFFQTTHAEQPVAE